MGHFKLKALVIKKLREVWPNHIKKEMFLRHYKEEPGYIQFTVKNCGELSLGLLQAFADIFQTKDITAGLGQVVDVVKTGSHIYSTQSLWLTITIRGGSWTNIHSNKRIKPNHRFDLEV